MKEAGRKRRRERGEQICLSYRDSKEKQPPWLQNHSHPLHRLQVPVRIHMVSVSATEDEPERTCRMGMEGARGRGGRRQEAGSGKREAGGGRREEGGRWQEDGGERP